MRELLKRQLLTARGGVEGGPLDVDAFVAAVALTYETVAQERRVSEDSRRQMEQELRAANEKLREESAAALSSAQKRFLDAIEIGTGPLMVLDADLNFIAWNAAAERVLGRARTHLARGKPLAGCARGLVENGDIKAPPEHAEAWIKISVDNVRAAEYPLESKVAGRWYQQRSRKLLDGGYLNAWMDITDLKTREKELAAAKVAAESANRLKSLFLATMSHELRTPLNAILGFSEAIRDQIFGADARAKYIDYARDIHRSGQHLHALICDVLDVSKIEAGNYQLYIETLDGVVAAKDCHTMIAPVAEKAGVALAFSCDARSIDIACDVRALRQIILNVLSNAVKFTPRDGRVELRLATDGGSLIVSVTDTGIGIAPEKLQALFQPFHQVDASMSRRYEGTGLGLYISKRLAELHGGTIRLDSTPGQGTRATVMLPLTQAATADNTTTTRAVAAG